MKTKKRYQDMTARELAGATREFDEPAEPGGKPMSRKDQQWFDVWQKKALANEAAGAESALVRFVISRKLIGQIGEAAKRKHTTPVALAKQVFQDAIHKAVA